VNDVVDAYLSSTIDRSGTRRKEWTDIAAAPGDDRIRVRKVAMVSENGEPLDSVDMGTAFAIVIEYWNLIDGSKPFLEIIFRIGDGTVFHSFSLEDGMIGSGPLSKGLYSATCVIPGGLLNAGVYHVEINFQHGSMSRYFTHPDQLLINVHDTATRGKLPYLGRFLGSIHPKLIWRQTRSAESFEGASETRTA
jgi:lipopolysaccharide transport system ATP-binding protein